jgi:hypothetical protein
MHPVVSDETVMYGYEPSATLIHCTRNYRKVLSSESPRVEAGKNTSIVIPASRKRRRKGNPVVSDESVPADLRKDF